MSVGAATCGNSASMSIWSTAARRRTAFSGDVASRCILAKALMSSGEAFGAAAREGAVDNELGDTLRMEHCMCNCGGAALRNTEQGVALKLLRRNHRLKVPTEGRERQFIDVSVRQAIAAPVIADEVMPACEEVQQRATDRVVPFILEMVEPGRSTHQCRTLTDARHREIEAIGGAAEGDLLSART